MVVLHRTAIVVRTDSYLWIVFDLDELFDHFGSVRLPVLHYAPKNSVHFGVECVRSIGGRPLVVGRARTLCPLLHLTAAQAQAHTHTLPVDVNCLRTIKRYTAYCRRRRRRRRRSTLTQGRPPTSNTSERARTRYCVFVFYANPIPLLFFCSLFSLISHPTTSCFPSNSLNDVSRFRNSRNSPHFVPIPPPIILRSKIEEYFLFELQMSFSVTVSIISR